MDWLQFLVLFERHDEDIKIVGLTFVYALKVIVVLIEFFFIFYFISRHFDVIWSDI